MPLARIPHHPFPSAEQAAASDDMGLGRPVLFQVTRVGSTEPLWPFLLAMHVNPNSLQEQFNKSKSVVMTRGGFVEFAWPDELTTLSADGTSGAFIGPDSGLTSDGATDAQVQVLPGRPKARDRPFRGRHGTMAWERQQDLLELFRSNGQIFNGSGTPVLRSQIMCICDRGIFIGWFTTFEVSETSETPYQFKISWEFKIVQTIYKLPVVSPYPDTNTLASERARVAQSEETLRNPGNDTRTAPVPPNPLNPSPPENNAPNINTNTSNPNRSVVV